MPDFRRTGWVTIRSIGWAAVLFVFSSACFAPDSDPFSKIPAEQRQAHKNRLDVYIKLQHSQDWPKLYDLVSADGRGGISLEKFVAAMKAGHGRDFANE